MLQVYKSFQTPALDHLLNRKSQVLASHTVDDASRIIFSSSYIQRKLPSHFHHISQSAHILVFELRNRLPQQLTLPNLAAQIRFWREPGVRFLKL